MMFQRFPKVYFWTFTFVKVHEDWKYPLLWNGFMKDVYHFFGGTVCGLRVIEIHPGQYSHGLHYHALLSRRIAIQIMKRLGKRHGMGRISVSTANIEAAHYLAKYLTKENGLSKGMRQWGTIGGFKGVKKNSIQIDSVITRNIKWSQKHCKLQQFSYAFFRHIAKESLIYGEINDWPQKSLNTIHIKNAKAQTLKSILSYEPEEETKINSYPIVPSSPWMPTERYRIQTKTGWTDFKPYEIKTNEPF